VPARYSYVFSSLSSGCWERKRARVRARERERASERERELERKRKRKRERERAQARERVKCQQVGHTPAEVRRFVAGRERE